MKVDPKFVILKHMGKTPSMASRERCHIKFFTPLDLIKNPLKAVENLHNSAFGNAQETPAAIAIPNQATATMVSMRAASQRPRRMVRKPEHLPDGNNSVTIGIYHRPFPYWRLIVGSKQFQSHRFVAAKVAPMA